MLLHLGHCAVATVAVCGFWQAASCGQLRDATSNLPKASSNPLSNRSVLHDGRKQKTVVSSKPNSPPAQGTQSGPFEIHVYLAVKRKTVVAWAEYLPKSPDLFVCQCRPGPFGQTVEFFLPLPAVRVAMVTKWTLAIRGFVSTMLWLKFRSDGYPTCVWGLCSSSEDAKVRLGWLVVVHDDPGPLAVFRERGVGKSVARRPCPPRPDVRLSPRQCWRCYFNVQRYLSPEVSVHFIFLRLSISGELRTIDFCPEASTCTFVTNLAGHSAIVKRKKKRNQHEQLVSTATDEQRFSLSALSNMHRASNSNQDIVHLSSQGKTRKSG